ncbi:hypothetical protein IWQ57_001637 [Coemansia nantahalensis]|uniref:Uncharacterized protein n=1 Tax=Coemansia nantahalensis TaxID=2789366 RepID=A0ACC1K3N2_9FUNG|nr:hypothetical protein IWQ57_001637 [Coemansia nantahalensis]
MCAHDFGDMMGVLNTEPCAREGLLYGLGAGIGAGVLGFFKRGRVLSAGNWGVAGFLVVAVAAKQLCHFQRAHEHAKLQTIIEEGMSKHKAAPAVAGFEPRPDSTAAPAAAAAEDKTAPASKTASK